MAQRFLAAHSAGQSEIENDGVEAFTFLESLPINVYAVDSALCFRDFVADSFQSENDQRTDRFFIIDDQNATTLSFDRRDSQRGCFNFCQNREVPRGRQVESE